MAVDLLNMPAGRFETHDLICAIRQLNSAVDGDVVVVPKHDQLAELVTTRKTDGLLRHALHQAAIARDNICVVIDDLFAVTRALDFFGHREAYRIGNALPQWACSCLNRIGKKVFWVTRCKRTLLTEVVDLIQSDLCVAHKIQ